MVGQSVCQASSTELADSGRLTRSETWPKNKQQWKSSSLQIIKSEAMPESKCLAG